MESHATRAGGDTAGNGEPGRRVVLLCWRGEAPEPLLAGLRRREAAVSVVRCLEAAMVELAGPPKHALVIHELDAMPRQNELLRAVATYYSKVVCWASALEADGAGFRLARVDGSARWGAAPQSDTRGVDPAAGDARPPPRGNGRDRSTSTNDLGWDEPLVTAEELDMLLGRTDPGRKPGPQEPTGEQRP